MSLQQLKKKTIESHGNNIAKMFEEETFYISTIDNACAAIGISYQDRKENDTYVLLKSLSCMDFNEINTGKNVLRTETFKFLGIEDPGLKKTRRKRKT